MNLRFFLLFLFLIKGMTEVGESRGLGASCQLFRKQKFSVIKSVARKFLEGGSKFSKMCSKISHLFQ